MRILHIAVSFALFILVVSCEKQYNPGFLITPPPVVNPNSEGTLVSATPNITEYPSGIALNNTHTVTVQVNVTKTGTYTITTDTINKIYFNASGTFNSTGMQTVVLQGHDIPDTSGICNLTVKYGNSRRSFSAEVYDWWEFEAGGVKHTGRVDTAFFNNSFLFSSLIIQGIKPNTDTTFDITPFLPAGNTITSGTYAIMERRNQVLFSFDAISNPGAAFYHAEPADPIPPSNFTLQLTYNATKKIAEGTFGGTATNDIGMLPTLIQIINGRFRVKVRP